MTSLGAWGRGGGFGSPFSSDLWDPTGFGLMELRRGRDDDVSAVAHTNIDWRETDKAHIIRADLPGLFAIHFSLLFAHREIVISSDML